MYSPALARAFTFSKQDFANSRACAGFAWLAVHQPQLVPADDVEAAARRERTHTDVALAARDLFPGGVAIDVSDPENAVAATAQAIAAGASTLFNATVRTDRGLLATADVLVRLGDHWMLGEVKATGGVKGDHIADIAYQAAVFAEAGIALAETRLILLRKAYRRRGAVEPRQLFESHDVTARVRRRLPAAEREITEALAATSDPDRPAPCLCDMGTRSQRCPAFGHFHPEVPGTGTVYDLGSVSGDVLEKVLARGVSSLADWPDDIAVSARQRRQIDVHRRGVAHVDAGALGDFLDRLEYPLHFLDYETFQTAIPLFDGCWPWVQIPFQYSLHIVGESGACDHRSFLWTEPRQFPVPALLERAQSDIGEHGSVVVWNRGFELSRNREMAEMVPAAAAFLEQVNDRMVDLMDIVRLGAWVDPAFNGSASLKKVLPVADPGLSYATLAIGDGAAASARWFDAVMGDPEAVAVDERAAVFEALRAYCHLDTLGMVRILYHVRTLLGRV